MAETNIIVRGEKKTLGKKNRNWLVRQRWQSWKMKAAEWDQGGAGQRERRWHETGETWFSTVAGQNGAGSGPSQWPAGQVVVYPAGEECLPPAWDTPGTWKLCACMLSHVGFLVTSWTIACQAPLSIELSRQEYWSRLLFLFQGIFPPQGLNLYLLCLLHWQVDSLPLSHQESPFGNCLVF